MKLLTYYKSGIIFIIKSPYIFIKYFLIGIKALLTTFPIAIIKKIINILKKEKTPKDIISFSIISLSLAAYLISIFTITRWYVQTERNKKFVNSLIEQSNSIVINNNNTNYSITFWCDFCNSKMLSYCTKMIA